MADVGLVGAPAAAHVVGWFEDQLRATVLLAFFLPGIVYLADAVGTQTGTIAVRGLSIGIPMRRMVLRELLAGAAIGGILAVAAGPLIWWRWGDAGLAVAIALAIGAACTTATSAALLLPWCWGVSDWTRRLGAARWRHCCRICSRSSPTSRS
ncbi:MAG TPA: magnesium transporter [Gemmatimonadales bacterium]|nr:magnesium transporter [Gemmatimonadales bacterium]